jgi:energy-coupling factor transporter ATP-binding protein EcfA2
MGESRRDHLLDELSARLRRAEHVVVYGPSGIGKTTLFSELRHVIAARGVPCAIAPRTDSLHDLMSALEPLLLARPAQLEPRRLRGLLRDAADVAPAALLLDHVTRMGTATKKFLRSLRGTQLGVAFAVDVDGPRDKSRMRKWCLSHTELQVPPTSSTTLRRLLADHIKSASSRLLSPHALEELVEAAAGRPGYVASCFYLVQEARYWVDARLHLALLQNDAEIATRNRGGWARTPFVTGRPAAKEAGTRQP